MYNQFFLFIDNNKLFNQFSILYLHCIWSIFMKMLFLGFYLLGEINILYQFLSIDLGSNRSVLSLCDVEMIRLRWQTDRDSNKAIFFLFFKENLYRMIGVPKWKKFFNILGLKQIWWVIFFFFFFFLLLIFKL